MSDSILTSTKKALDIPENYDVFDGNIIMHINSTFSTLTQLGIGPVDGFEIADSGPTWADYLGNNPRLNLVKSYMYLAVRRLFDPPTTSFLLDATKAQMDEYVWRMTNELDTSSNRRLSPREKITGNAGDEYTIQLTNPSGGMYITAEGEYTVDFVPLSGNRAKEAKLDTSQKALGILSLTVTIANGTYTVRRASPRRTLLVLDVRAV